MSRLSLLRPLLFASVLAAALTLVVSRCFASDHSRPIVFSARYYLKPGSKGTSHFHLYRINPDGTGLKQITFGSYDDYDPVWSPDGKWIAFGRSNDPLGKKLWLSVLNVASGEIQKVTIVDWDEYRPTYKWEIDPQRLHVPTRSYAEEYDYLIGDHSITPRMGEPLYLYSPDGHWRADALGENSLNVSEHIEISWSEFFDKPGTWTDFTWISPNTVVCLGSLKVGAEDRDQSVVLFNMSTSMTAGVSPNKQTSVPIISKLEKFYAQKFYASDPENAPTDIIADGIEARPNHAGEIILRIRETNSTSGDVADFYSFSLIGGSMHTIAPFSEFVSFSPDGKFCASAPMRDPVPYSHWHHGQIRYVWAAPLRVIDLASSASKQLTPSTTWVYSSDWRR